MPELHSGDPRRLGSYEVLERLGEGGQGVVYLGRDAAGTKVAIKLLRGDLTEDETARSRFVREVQAAKQVARFCTAQVLEADVAGDRPYIVSEFVPGPSLQKLVAEEGPRTGAALDRLAIGTMTALVAIHQAGIVHRDFKPHNVLMAPDGPRVIDFGIARALDPGSAASTKAIGTPAYMAPEQVMGTSLTEAVDVFSWGSTMVFAATGRPPFGQDSIPAVINRLLNEEPNLDGVPDDLRDLIRECLAKDPQARPTAQTLMMRLIGGGGPSAVPPAAPMADATRLDGPEAADATRVAGPGMAAAMGAAAAGDELPTAVLAEGRQMAGQATGASRTRAAGPVSGTLPGVPGYPPPPGQRRPGDGQDRSKGPIIATVAAVAAVLLLIAGLVYAANGDDDPAGRTTPSPTVERSTDDQGDDDQQLPQEPEEPDPPQHSTEPEPQPEPTGGQSPSVTPEPSEPSQPPQQPSSPPPSDGGGGDDGGGGSGGGNGGGDDGGGSGGDGGGAGDPGAGGGTSGQTAE